MLPALEKAAAEDLDVRGPRESGGGDASIKKIPGSALPALWHFERSPIALSSTATACAP